MHKQLQYGKRYCDLLLAARHRLNSRADHVTHTLVVWPLEVTWPPGIEMPRSKVTSAPTSLLQLARLELMAVSSTLPPLLPVLPIANHCHQNMRNNTYLRGIGLINLHGQQHFGDAELCLIARVCNRSQVHFILYKSYAAQTKPSPGPQTAALLLWKKLT